MSDHGIGGFPDGAGCPRCGPKIPKLCVSRIYYFLTFAMLGTFWMLLATFARYLGLSGTQAGIITGARPLLSGITVVIWTHIADRYQWTKKPIILLSVTSHCLLSISLVFFRPMFTTSPYLDCGGNLTSLTTSAVPSTAATVANNAWHVSNASAAIVMGNCSLVNATESVPTNVGFGSLTLSLAETFAVLLTLVLANESVGSSITTMADVATYSHLGPKNYVNFGWIRVFGAGGWALGVFSLTLASQYFNTSSAAHGTGTVISVSRSSKVYLSGNYSLVFGCLSVVLGFSFLTALLFQFKQHTTQVARGALRNTLSQVMKPRIFLLAYVIFHTGLVMGANLSFLFWLIQDLGGKQSIMGIASLIAALSDVPFYILAPTMIRFFGPERVVLFGICCQIIYFFGISGVNTAWAVLLFQPVMGGMHGLFWAAIQAIFVPLSSPGTESLMIGLLHTLMYGFGTGIGSFVGGALVDATSSQWMFRILAIASFFVLLLHFTSLLCFGVQPVPSKNGFRRLDKSDRDSTYIGDDDGETSESEKETMLVTSDVNSPISTLKKSVME